MTLHKKRTIHPIAHLSPLTVDNILKNVPNIPREKYLDMVSEG